MSPREGGFMEGLSRLVRKNVVGPLAAGILGAASPEKASASDADSMVYISPEVSQVLKEKGISPTEMSVEDLKLKVSEIEEGIKRAREADEAQKQLEATLAKNTPQKETNK